MRSKKVTVSIPHRHWDALEKLAPELGYDGARELITWAPLYFFLCAHKKHTFTAGLSGLPPDVQDEIIERVVSAYERGETGKGSYLEAVLTDVAQRLGITVPLEVIQAVVADTVRNRPRKAQG